MGVSCVPSWGWEQAMPCWEWTSRRVGQRRSVVFSSRWRACGTHVPGSNKVCTSAYGIQAEAALAPRAGPRRSRHDEVPGVAWKRRPASQRQLAPEALVARMRQVQQASQRLATPVYLSPAQ
jgi:hypothetical protein